MTLTLPTIHLNGTGRDSLTRDYETALERVQAALDAVETEHRARLDALGRVRDELTEILIHLSDQADNRGRGRR